MKDQCQCGSYAINPSLHERDNSDLDLCDVCYWKKRAKNLKSVTIDLSEQMQNAICRIANGSTVDASFVLNQCINKLKGADHD